MSSRNLRCIMDYARKFPHGATELRKHKRWLHVRFPDGSTCATRFSDATVLRDWIKDRIRFGRGKFNNGTVPMWTPR